MFPQTRSLTNCQTSSNFEVLQDAHEYLNYRGQHLWDARTQNQTPRVTVPLPRHNTRMISLKPHNTVTPPCLCQLLCLITQSLPKQEGHTLAPSTTRSPSWVSPQRKQQKSEFWKFGESKPRFVIHPQAAQESHRWFLFLELMFLIRAQLWDFHAHTCPCTCTHAHTHLHTLLSIVDGAQHSEDWAWDVKQV